MHGAFLHALELIISGDHEVYAIAFASLRFSTISTIISAILGIPLGVLISVSSFRGKKALVVVLNTLMAVPTVVVGLFFYSLISRSGPLGGLGILFTPSAIIVGQTILSLPIIVSFTHGGLGTIDPLLTETLETLGADRLQVLVMIVREGRAAIVSALLAGYGRVIGEVGVSMMLGGNIRWYTRTLTTAIALETSKGEFVLGLALGIILLILALGINAATHWATGRER